MNGIRKIRPASPAGSQPYRPKPNEAWAQNVEILPPRSPLPRYVGKRRTDTPIAPPRPSTPFLAQYVDQLWSWPRRDKTSQHADAGRAYIDANELSETIAQRQIDRKF